MYKTIICLLFSCTVFGQAHKSDYVPGELIIKFKNGKSESQKEALRSQMSANLDKNISLNRAELWNLDQSQDVEELINEYRNHTDIEYIEPNYYYYLTSHDGEESGTAEPRGKISNINQNEDSSVWGKLKGYFKKSFISLTSMPNDSEFGNQWALHNFGQDGGTPDVDIDAPEAWGIETESQSIVIGVIDTGVDWTHPDLVNNIWQNLAEDADGDGQVLEWDGNSWAFDPGDINNIDDDGNGYIDDFIGWDFSDNDNDPYDYIGHGTHVAGIIGAEGNNGIGVAGVTWDVQIAPLKIFSNRTTSGDIVAVAIDYAVMMGMPLSNNSYSNTPVSYLMIETIINAKTQGHLYVASAGNFNSNNDDNSNYPSSYPFDNILSVSATDKNEMRWFQSINKGSNYGATSVDIAAPGSWIFSTMPQNNYSYYSGTSMAAPHVAGACALLWERYPDKSYAEIKAALLNTVDMMPHLPGNNASGGRLNLSKALTYFDAASSSCRVRDSLALVALYNTTNGANWITKWDLAQPIDQWHGVTLNESGCVISLNLQGNFLTGNFPSDIGNLVNLEYLNLSRNFPTGSIPPDIGNLVNLEYLNLFDNNNLTGNIPSEIGDLVKLEYLILQQNQLNGTLPSEIGNLTDIKYIDLSQNQLTGNIPSQIGNIINLESLSLWGNQLTGNIPMEIGTLNKLEYLSLNSNQLTGNIPNEIGNLSELNYLLLDNNQLTGNIPAEFGDLNNLQTYGFRINDNQLEGCFPSNLMNLSHLATDNSRVSNGNNFDASWSDFIYSGAGACDNPYPNCRLNDSLSLVTLYNSTGGPNWTNTWDLNQPIDTWFGVELTGFACVRSLVLRNNLLNGSIPTAIGDLVKLETMDFHQNQLIGNIPPEIGNLIKLKNLYLSHNNLTGSIPSQLEYLDNLEILNLSDNQLSGVIPKEIGNLDNLNDLWIYDNQLVGGIPTEILNLVKLTHIGIHNNQLSGCYDESLINLCIPNIATGNDDISDGNNFDASWEDFCNSGAGTCTDQVWPGDFDYNGIVDENDILVWGIAFGYTGGIRPNATTIWEGQQAPDWTLSVEGINSKHQDANGDGIVEVEDLLVHANNIGSIHDFTNPVYTADTMIIQLEEGGIIAGDPSYDVYVTYDGGAPIDVHGVSGVIEFGNQQINEVTIDITNSSLEPSNVVKVYDQANNRLHFALTRTDKVNKECNGPIAKIIVETGYIPAGNSYSIDMRNGSTIRANGDVVNVAGTSFYPYPQSNLANNNLVVGASVRHERCTSLGSITLNVEGGVAPYAYNWNTGAVGNSLIDLTANIYEVTVVDAFGQEETLSVEVEDFYNLIPDENGFYPDCLNPDCPTLLTPSGNVITGTYHAGTAINSIGHITGDVDFKAGEMVLLRGGFEVLQDKVFTAEIEDCGN